MWADIDSASQEDYLQKQKQIKEVKQQILQMHGMIQEERKAQRQTLKDLRIFLTNNNTGDDMADGMCLTQDYQLDQFNQMMQENQQLMQQFQGSYPEATQSQESQE